MNSNLTTKQFLIVFLILGLLIGLPFTPWFKRHWAYHQFNSAPTVSGAAELAGRFPGSTQAIEAEAMIWEKISRAPQASTVTEYVFAFRSGPHHQAAEELLAKLNAQAAAEEFEALSKGKDALKMGVFLNAHPDFAERGRGWLLKRLSDNERHPPAEVLRQVFTTCKDDKLLFNTAGFETAPLVGLPDLREALQEHFRVFGLKVEETKDPKLAHFKVSGFGQLTDKMYGAKGEGFGDIAGKDLNKGHLLSTELTLQVPGGAPLWRRRVRAETPDSVSGSISQATDREYVSQLRKVLSFW